VAPHLKAKDLLHVTTDRRIHFNRSFKYDKNHMRALKAEGSGLENVPIVVFFLFSSPDHLFVIPKN
jgi:hypothetical protein